MRWTKFSKRIFAGIRHPNPTRPFLYCQTWWTVSCGWTCGCRKGKLWCLLSAWCNTTALVKFSELSPELCVTQFELVYLEQCFSICVPWNISFARRFHGQINLDKHTLCFLSWCFTLQSWEPLSGIWTSQWMKLLMWQLFRLDGDSGDFFSSQWPL